MKIIRTILPVALTVSLALSVATPAFAAPATDEQPTSQYQIHCEDGACSLAIDAEKAPPLLRAGAALTSLAFRDRLPFLPERSTLKVGDALVLNTPAGTVPLPDSELVVALNDEGRIERLHGTAQVSFPTLGVLKDVQMTSPAVADVGLDRGEHLAYLGAPLDPERQYLFFRLGSGFDLTAQVGEIAGVDQELDISVPDGQNATLIVDTEEPFVYLVGTISVNPSGPMALATRFLAPGDGFDLGDLPLGQRAKVHVSGLYPGDVNDAYVKVGGGYGVDGGALDNWLGLDITPLSVEGVLTASPDGALLEGRIGASIEPEHLFDGDVQIAAYIPFHTDALEPYVRLEGRADLPIAHVQADLAAAWSPSLDLLVDGSLVTPWSSPSVAARFPEPETTQAQTGRPAPLAAVGQFLAPVASEVGEQASQGLVVIKDASGAIHAWIVDTADTGRAVVAQRVAALTK